MNSQNDDCETEPYKYGNSLDRYAQFLREAQNGWSKAIAKKVRYIDPDSTTSPSRKRCCYYEHLAMFLNIQWQKRYRVDSHFRRLVFLPPTKLVENTALPKVFQSVREGGNKSGNENKIAVCEWLTDGNVKLLFYLTSDQLGFTVNPSIGFDYPEPLHPIPIALKLLKQEQSSNEEVEDIIKFLACYVVSTRTLGGGFLWPTNSNCKRQYSTYNLIRGVRVPGSITSLEDRVDLTLWEVREYFLSRQPGESVRKQDTGSSSVSKYSVLMGKDGTGGASLTKHMRLWFDIFDSFDDYIEFLMLNPFVTKENGQVDPSWPVDIYESDISDKAEVMLKSNKNNKLEIRHIDNLETAKRVMENLKLLIKKRTCEMKKLIDPYKDEKDDFWKNLDGFIIR